jgi:hypothetical protein
MTTGTLIPLRKRCKALRLSRMTALIQGVVLNRLGIPFRFYSPAQTLAAACKLSPIEFLYGMDTSHDSQAEMVRDGNRGDNRDGQNSPWVVDGSQRREAQIYSRRVCTNCAILPTNAFR